MGRNTLVALLLTLSASIVIAQDVNQPIPRAVIPGEHPVAQGEHADESGGHRAEEPRDDRGQQHTLQHIEDIDPHAVTDEHPGGESRQPTNGQHSQYDISDLRAQEQIAYWTRVAGASAAIAALASLAGIVLIFFTLHATKGLLREAEAATSAAKETVEVTRHMGKMQAQAYLHLDQATVGYQGTMTDPLPQGGSEAFPVIIWTANNGLTPARWYEYHYECTIQSGHGAERKTELVAQGTTPRWQALAAGQKLSFPITKRPILEAVHRLADDGRYDVLLWLKGRVVYQTMFDEERSDNFSVFVTADRLNRWRSDHRRREGGRRPDPLRMQFSAVDD